MNIKGGRTYNLDLLRIVAMVMIVTLHFLGKGQVLTAYPNPSLKYYAVWGVEAACLIAVNCYVLLSGYFLVHSQFKVKKVVALALQVLFYSLGIYSLLMSLGIAKFSSVDLFNSLFPILSGVYWFISIYMAMYILSPFLNKLLLSIDRKTHLLLVTCLIFIFSVWPSFFVLGDSFTFAGLNITNGYSAIWFITLYCVAAFIRLHYKPSYNLKKYLKRYVGIAVTGISVFTVTNYLGTVAHNQYFSALFPQMQGYNSLVIFSASLALFMVFVNLKITNERVNRAIGVLSPLTFGVYLIHIEPHMNTWLWQTLSPSSHIYNPRFVLYAFVVVMSIYAACSVIDWCRLKIFGLVARTSISQNINNIITRFLLNIGHKAAYAVERIVN